MGEKNIIVGPEINRLFTDVGLGELLFSTLENHEDNILQVDGATDELVPASLLLNRSVQLAKWLKSRNITLGDSITVISENCLEFCVVPVAGLFIGATFAPLNPDYTPGELKHVLKLSKPKLIFCSLRTIDKMLKIWPDHPYVEGIILFGKTPINNPHVVMFEDIMKGITVGNIDTNFELTKVTPSETIATILCSSGTTGLPKGVMCSHESIVVYVDIVREMHLEILQNDDPSDAMMGLTPFFHSLGFMLMLMNILRGKKMVVLSRFKPKLFLDAIVKNDIKRMVLPPPVMLVLLKHPLTKNYDLSGIKEVRTGAAPMGKNMEKEIKERFKIKHVSQGYGMTETTFGVLIINSEDKFKLGSVGHIVPGMMAKIIDADGKALGPYQEGELCFKGPLVMKGYVGDRKATEETIDQDQWLHTGDVAYYDDDQYFFIVDRLKELIKYKAFQVAPAELEALLITHPAIQDAAVIGLPDEEAGELPMAYVVKKTEITADEVKDFVATNVSPQKQLRGGVIFIDEIPKNPTGKILRRFLRDKATKLKSKL